MNIEMNITAKCPHCSTTVTLPVPADRTAYAAQIDTLKAIKEHVKEVHPSAAVAGQRHPIAELEAYRTIGGALLQIFSDATTLARRCSVCRKLVTITMYGGALADAHTALEKGLQDHEHEKHAPVALEQNTRAFLAAERATQRPAHQRAREARLVALMNEVWDTNTDDKQAMFKAVARAIVAETS